MGFWRSYCRPSLCHRLYEYSTHRYWMVRPTFTGAYWKALVVLVDPVCNADSVNSLCTPSDINFVPSELSCVLLFPKLAIGNIQFCARLLTVSYVWCHGSTLLGSIENGPF